ncbi:TetR/AcrR family transcriptional regulator [Parapedobacter tibetensis]|uniref:TetR/AcrR family transcriptional regulator n=1 Tax=Parapedobacter tibetensis TaxID=2972951 RepID=UPI00214D44B8|nr:TetR/AcrR family transcriptional regulator [Parapedobacter tibetensis]
MGKNKKTTMRRLVLAVGELYDEQGVKGIGVNKVARKAGVDKNLIYRYFGSLENLLEQYVLMKQNWDNTIHRMLQTLDSKSKLNSEDLTGFFLEKQFATLCQDDALRKILFSKYTDHENVFFERIYGNREAMIVGLCDKAGVHLEDADIGYRSVFAVLLAATYFLSLEAHSGSGVFCAIDLKCELGKEEIKKAIRAINGWAFEMGRVQGQDTQEDSSAESLKK